MNLEDVERELQDYISHLEMQRTPEPLTLEQLQAWLMAIAEATDETFYHDPSYHQGQHDIKDEIKNEISDAIDALEIALSTLRDKRDEVKEL
jgi:hypothetical protein